MCQLKGMDNMSSMATTCYGCNERTVNLSGMCDRCSDVVQDDHGDEIYKRDRVRYEVSVISEIRDIENGGSGI